MQHYCDKRAAKNNYKKTFYYIDTDEIQGYFLLLKNNIFIARSEDTGSLYTRA